MKKHSRYYSQTDRLCIGIDQALRALLGKGTTTGRPLPGIDDAEPELDQEQRKHAAGLMRVNHAGEVCAQALYHGQGLVSRSPSIQQQMQQAAIEEGDHLYWCRLRLAELGSHTSYFNPVWYVGSFAIGMAAGLIGDGWSLGFVAETERQVVKHLEDHLQLLPGKDQKSAKILEQMRIDEAKHHDEALNAGAMPLPFLVQKGMGLVSKIMVKIAYYF